MKARRSLFAALHGELGGRETTDATITAMVEAQLINHGANGTFILTGAGSAAIAELPAKRRSYTKSAHGSRRRPSIRHRRNWRSCERGEVGTARPRPLGTRSRAVTTRRQRRLPMIRLEGSCRCGAVSFSVDSHAPVPFQRCYCTICRKTAGSGGYAINLSAVADTLQVKDRAAIGTFHAEIDGVQGSAERSFCTRCGTPLWVYDATWPELLHPFRLRHRHAAAGSSGDDPPAARRQAGLGRCRAGARTTSPSTASRRRASRTGIAVTGCGSSS